MLERLVYVSRPAPGTGLSEVRHIVGRAEIRNRQRDVTGMLAWVAGEFVQVLEGRPDMLDDVWACIARDPRHVAVRIVSREAVPRRRFDRWGLHLLTSDALTAALHQLTAGDLAVDPFIDLMLREAEYGQRT